MLCLISPSLASASTTLRPPSKLPTTIWRVSGPARSFQQLKLRCRPDETVALRPRCQVVRAQMNHADKDEPNHFVEEIQFIDVRFVILKYRTSTNKKFYIPDDFQQHIDQVLPALVHVCYYASDAVSLASQLVDSGHSATGLSTKICADTVRRTVGEYVGVFLCITKECYKKKLDRDTVARFVGALRGLGSVSHILIEDALEALNDIDPKEGLLEYKFNSDVKSLHFDFNCKMDDFEDRIWNLKTDDPVQMVFETIRKSSKVTKTFLGLMLARRERTLEKARGGSK